MHNTLELLNYTDLQGASDYTPLTIHKKGHYLHQRTV